MLSQNETLSNNKETNKCEECGELYEGFLNIKYKWCKPCQINRLKNYIQFSKGGFSMVYSAIWKNGRLYYDVDKKEWTTRKERANKKVALKCLLDSQNITNEFLNEIKIHSMMKSRHNLKVYGISQNPDTKEYIMVFEFVEGGSLNDWINKNFNNLNWKNKLKSLYNIFNALDELHQRGFVHHDFHTGNILIKNVNWPYISDMGLCREASNIDETKIFGVIPYLSPEVLKGNPYTQAADIYSAGMIMYVIATGRQPFANRAHDEYLVINICKGDRPEINELEAPKCYIDLMKNCWDSNPDKRPKIAELKTDILKFYSSYTKKASEFKTLMKAEKGHEHYEIEKQFKEAEEHRKSLTSESTTHSQAIYTSRLLNSFTNNIPKYDNVDNNTVEIIDFTKL
ncbi:kinase-like domain-containing protein [Rhizophagus clarus]|uniref:Kinase-like domain-containing protein n=1 Tax=Rhizophagus clarus TaxID=94130 RepID=A0A8H3KZ42_9GLOM|nr:kinase-like domain-containing protein [Rhizophagus clarus]